MHEGDEPEVLADLGAADVLSRKDVTEIHLDQRDDLMAPMLPYSQDAVNASQRF